VIDLLPADAWDSQVHVFGGPYPLAPERRYEPPPSSDLDAMLELHRTLGFKRGVVVQASAQGWDSRYVADVLKKVPHYSGVILMHDHISDRELEDLHAAGVRGGRFTFLPGFAISNDPRSLNRLTDRLKALGWFAKLFATARHWPELKGYLNKIDIPIIIDHLGYVDPSAGLDQPAAKIIRELLKRENWWMMLSCGDRISKVPDWSDVIPFAQSFIECAPDRVIWGSDWPHVAHHDGILPNTRALLDMVAKYTQDKEQIRKIFCANPERIFVR
jgi:2-pyrone-4,6-dicarboxylate lactonase